MLLTVTRASWLGCLVSTLIILLLGVGRRAVIVLGLLAIPLILAGLFVLQQKRNVAFIDQADQSTTWRETVWREGFELLVSKPRHLLIGIGMDSIKRHWRDWGMFDSGRIPWGHMHSNLLQIALERGVPALILWLAFLFVYARTLWRTLRSAGEARMDRARNFAGCTGRTGGVLYFRPGALQLGRLGSSDGLLHDYGTGSGGSSTSRRSTVAWLINIADIPSEQIS